MTDPEVNRRWRMANKEKIRARAKLYRETHKEQDRAYQSLYYSEHRGRGVPMIRQIRRSKLEPESLYEIRKAVNKHGMDPMHGLMLAVIAQAVEDKDTEWLETEGRDWSAIICQECGILRH
jgi:hypothetical protein